MNFYTVAIYISTCLMINTFILVMTETQHCRNTETLAAVLAGAHFALFLTKIESCIIWKGVSNSFYDWSLTSSTDNNSNFCHRVLCRQCKETHVIDLDTKYHHMTLYVKIIKRENYTNHSNQVYERYCESYDIQVCFNCNNHKIHK